MFKTDIIFMSLLNKQNNTAILTDKPEPLPRWNLSIVYLRHNDPCRRMSHCNASNYAIDKLIKLRLNSNALNAKLIVPLTDSFI